MSKRPVLILLGGGRGNVPNFWSVLAYRPAHVYYLPCEGDAANLQYTEEFLVKKGLPHTILPPVPAFEPNSTLIACAKVIQEIGENPVLINMTQSPKLVAFGGAAAQQKHVHVSVFHRDTLRDRNYFVLGPETSPAPFAMTIDDYLAAYGRTGWSTFNVADFARSEVELGNVARNIAAQLPDYRDLIKQMRGQSPKGILHVGEPNPWHPRWTALFQRLQQFRLIHRLELTANSAAFQCVNHASWNFLSGGWLELYARDRAREFHRDGNMAPVFSDCRMSLMIPNHSVENEIDLACLAASGMLLYASCKTAAQENVDDLTEIVDRAELLGGQYCGKMMITTIPRSRLSANYYAQAKARHIEVVCGEELPRLTTHFEQAITSLLQHVR